MQRDGSRPSPDEPALIARSGVLAPRCGRSGSRRITARLRAEGGRVHHKRVERIWRQEGLRVPAKQPQRGRLWLADGSLLRRRHCRARAGTTLAAGVWAKAKPSAQRAAMSIPSPGEKAAWRSAAWALPYVAL